MPPRSGVVGEVRRRRRRRRDASAAARTISASRVRQSNALPAVVVAVGGARARVGSIWPKRSITPAAPKSGERRREDGAERGGGQHRDHGLGQVGHPRRDAVAGAARRLSRSAGGGGGHVGAQLLPGQLAPLAVLAQEGDRRRGGVGRPGQEVLGEVHAGLGEEAGPGDGAVAGVERARAGVAEHAAVVPDGLPELARMLDAPAVEGDGVGNVGLVAGGDGVAEGVEPGGRHQRRRRRPQRLAHGSQVRTPTLPRSQPVRGDARGACSAHRLCAEGGCGRGPAGRRGWWGPVVGPGLGGRAAKSVRARQPAKPWRIVFSVTARGSTNWRR